MPRVCQKRRYDQVHAFRKRKDKTKFMNKIRKNPEGKIMRSKGCF